MKDVKIIIDGKEYTAQMSDEQVKEIAQQERTRTGYERVKLGERFYTSAHEPCHSPQVEERKLSTRNALFERGDYVNDEQLFYDRDRARVLHDRLEQWQALNDEPVDWGNNKPKYHIQFDYQQKEICMSGACYTRDEGVVYFTTFEKAQEAIEVFRDELMWYFTEYRSRLDEKRTGAESND